MRELSEDAPSLFDAPPLPNTAHARNFVRWCCSFGSDFRNSPDITNLRYWTQKNKVQIKNGDEAEILEAARAVFLKRVEQMTRRSQPPLN